MLHQPDFGTPTPNPHGSKKARQELRKRAKQPLVLRNVKRTKYRVTWPKNPWSYVWEGGEWTRQCGGFTGEAWEPALNDLEVLVMTGASNSQVAQMAETVRKLKQNRQQYTPARWNNGRPCG